MHAVNYCWKEFFLLEHCWIYYIPRQTAATRFQRSSGIGRVHFKSISSVFRDNPNLERVLKKNEIAGVWNCLYTWTEDEQVLIFAKFSPGSPPIRNLNCSVRLSNCYRVD